MHGDLRSNNILVVSGTVRIIDFEWAGIADEAAFFMNHTDVVWSDGARDGQLQPIKPEHDLQAHER